jgi:hypothetical protein
MARSRISRRDINDNVILRLSVRNAARLTFRTGVVNISRDDTSGQRDQWRMA